MVSPFHSLTMRKTEKTQILTCFSSAAPRETKKRKNKKTKVRTREVNKDRRMVNINENNV